MGLPGAEESAVGVEDVRVSVRNPQEQGVLGLAPCSLTPPSPPPSAKSPFLLPPGFFFLRKGRI